MISDIQLKRIADGCVIDAYRKWTGRGIRIANHAFEIGGRHHEWLTIVGRGGETRIWQHFPTVRMIARIPGERVARLATPPRHGFGARAVRGHHRAEGRRGR